MGAEHVLLIVGLVLACAGFSSRGPISYLCCMFGGAAFMVGLARVIGL